MSWLSIILGSLSKWWKKNNSIGDIIKNNDKAVYDGVVDLVRYGWELKDHYELAAEVSAARFIAMVLKPLPDTVEIIASAWLETKITSIVKSAFTIKKIKTQEDAVAYIMLQLRLLK